MLGEEKVHMYNSQKEGLHKMEEYLYLVLQ